MYCVRCGAALQPAQGFCAGCGAAAANARHVETIQTRLASHLRMLAILWFAISAFRMIPGIALLTMFEVGSAFLPPETPGFVAPLLHLLGFIFLGCAAIGLIAGWGLLHREPWARTLTIVLGCISLVVDVPLGTALGIYTLWVLLPVDSATEYRRVSSAS